MDSYRQNLDRRYIPLAIVVVGVVLWGVLFYVTNPVKVIIPAERYVIFWFLSPSGDKLLYHGTDNGAFVYFLDTGPEILITDCPEFVWLNNESVYCYDEDKLVSINQIEAESFSKSAIKSVDEAEDNIRHLLEQTVTVYKLNTSDNKVILLVDRRGELDYYRVTESKALSTLLENYGGAITNFNDLLRRSDGEISPNQAYYYTMQEVGPGTVAVMIHNADNDQVLNLARVSSGSVKIGGWAADSSGIYFQAGGGGGLTHYEPQPIQKLCVPGAACSAGD